jgi:hypothetical protein
MVSYVGVTCKMQKLTKWSQKTSVCLSVCLLSVCLSVCLSTLCVCGVVTNGYQIVVCLSVCLSVHLYYLQIRYSAEKGTGQTDLFHYYIAKIGNSQILTP